jgi:hypothetical protein
MKRFNQIAAMLLVQIAVMSTSVNAQKADEKKGVLVIAQPAETVVRLKGSYEFAGKAPLSIPQSLSGQYQLSASKPGYESKSMMFFFDDKPLHKITLNLQPISTFKAGYRSLLLPGWGQRYKGANKRGLLFTGLALGAGVGTLVTVLDYKSDYDDAQDARDDYLRVRTNYEQAQAAYDKWQSAYETANDSYDRRQRSLVIAAAVWALNLLDAVLLPPRPGSSQNPDVTRIGYDQSRLELQVSF